MRSPSSTQWTPNKKSPQPLFCLVFTPAVSCWWAKKIILTDYYYLLYFKKNRILVPSVVYIRQLKAKQIMIISNILLKLLKYTTSIWHIWRMKFYLTMLSSASCRSKHSKWAYGRRLYGYRETKKVLKKKKISHGQQGRPAEWQLIVLCDAARIRSN